MRLAALEMIRALAHSLTAEEALADRMAQIAFKADALSDPTSAEAYRNLARTHRVRAIELGGRLAVLNQHYTNTFRTDR